MMERTPGTSRVKFSKVELLLVDPLILYNCIESGAKSNPDLQQPPKKIRLEREFPKNAVNYFVVCQIDERPISIPSPS